nr:LOW QUALITY PROTEIN: cysteine sulfinic acid decarboxylase-like [Cherax quadricarinatus]
MNNREDTSNGGKSEKNDAFGGKYEDNNLGKKCGWGSGPEAAHHAHFLRAVLDLLVEKAVFSGTDRSSKVVEWVEPSELQQRLQLDLGDDGVTQGDLLRHLDQVVRYSVKTGHPYFINQLFSRPVHHCPDVKVMYQLYAAVTARYGITGPDASESHGFLPLSITCVKISLSQHCNLCSLQQDKFYDTSYDVGDKHLQCGRRVDVLKFWTMWKAKGTTGLEKHVERVFEMSQLFADKIRFREGFKLLLEPECTNVCFWYEPPSLRTKRAHPEYNKLLNAVAPKIKERMVKTGSMMITYQPLRGQPNFFRLVLQNSQVNEHDINYFIAQIEHLGRDL